MAEGFNILVTGGGGYIGAVLVPALLDAGHKVTVLDNFMYQQTPHNLLCKNPSFNVVAGDARNETILKPLAVAADIIIPLAAIVGAPACDRDKTAAVSTNLEAILTLLKLLGTGQRLLVPITNSGYGVAEKGKLCTEEDSLQPVSLYGRTKVDAEAAVLERKNSISFRLATVFGMSPRMRIDLMVNHFVYRAVTERAVILFESQFKRNFIHVGDVARVFLHGLENFESMRGGPYNVGLSDANLSKYELCERIKAHLPEFVFLEAPIGEDPDKRDYIVSNEKIENTGFKPRYTLDDGIKELIKGYVMIRDRVYGNV
jgi:nucleoside-diphosphate-sugar epimerase